LHDVAGGRRPLAAALVGVLAVVSSGCALFGSDDVRTRSAAELPMRPVPTVPPPDATPGGAAATVPGSGDDEDLAPPVTEVIGDPRPDPEAPEPLPPLPDSPVVEACVLLADTSATATIADVVGATAVVDAVGPTVCRYTAGGAVAEVHLLDEATVENDWFSREGIEPVGTVSGDAVGIARFLAPGSDPAPGYTIALISRRRGAVVAVTGGPDDRGTAEALAALVDGAL
jgi:hypothetical protein